MIEFVEQLDLWLKLLTLPLLPYMVFVLMHLWRLELGKLFFGGVVCAAWFGVGYLKRTSKRI